MPVLGNLGIRSDRRRTIGFEGDQANLLDQGSSAQLRILPFLMRYFGQARADLGGSFSAARRGTTDAYRAALGDIAGRSGGLRNTTVAQNAILGAGAQRARGLQDIAAQEGNAFANLAMAQGEAGAGALSDQAGHFLSRSQIENQIFQNWFQARQARKGRKLQERGQNMAMIGSLAEAAGSFASLGLPRGT